MKKNQEEIENHYRNINDISRMEFYMKNLDQIRQESKEIKLMIQKKD